MYTLDLESRIIPVYCFMRDIGCGSGGWTIVMKTDGTKVKQGQFARQLSITFQKMVSFYFFVDFSNVLHLYFLVFALPLWKISI